jgi:hypothetical protein
MAKTKATAPAGMRRCIGSERFGIEAHDAPIGDFPAQPSQKDGLGRMCRTHWNHYTAGLARDRKARLAGERIGDEPKAPTTSKKRKARDANQPTEPTEGESPTATARQQAFEKRLAKVGAGSEEGQRMIERSATARRVTVDEGEEASAG